MKVLITRRKIERLTIRQKNEKRKFRCRICRKQSVFLTPDEMSQGFGIGFFDLVDRWNKNDLHFFEDETGMLLICGNSLLAAEADKKN